MKGTAEKVKGKVNEAVGNATDDPSKKAKGQLQQGDGEAQKQHSGLKEDVKDEQKRAVSRSRSQKMSGLPGVFMTRPRRACRPVATSSRGRACQG
ncbi:CsbD-like protein [Caballeronia sordidicola]|uniref:CsbD-like protein n=1 Tax=Caballeronia sordidicola TaxID=196367 RepID=A0A158IED8_CABSO|nr:CsbD-like protein [Caballeronia sordidicola]